MHMHIATARPDVEREPDSGDAQRRQVRSKETRRSQQHGHQRKQSALPVTRDADRYRGEAQSNDRTPCSIQQFISCYERHTHEWS